MTGSLILPEDRALPASRDDALAILHRRAPINSDALRACRELLQKERPTPVDSEGEVIPGVL